MLDSLKTRIPGGYFYERIKYLKKNYDCENDKVMKCYLEYCRYCYWHGAKNCVDNSFFHNADGFVEVEGMKFPQLKGKVIGDFWCEFPDLLLPYIIELHGKKYCFEQIEPLMVEGPYELNDNIAVHEGDVVIDCGANIGLFSAIASDKGAMVYAFEPDGDIIEEYLSKTKEFHNSIDIVPYALSDKCGETFFEKGLKTLGAGHLTNDSQQADFAVKTTTLDQFVAEYGITKVDYIKADIEGAERYMLKGAVNVLKKFAPRLSICTYHLPDDKTVLENIVKSANPDYVVEHRY